MEKQENNSKIPSPKDPFWFKNNQMIWKTLEPDQDEHNVVCKWETSNCTYFRVVCAKCKLLTIVCIKDDSPKLLHGVVCKDCEELIKFQIRVFDSNQNMENEIEAMKKKLIAKKTKCPTKTRLGAIQFFGNTSVNVRSVQDERYIEKLATHIILMKKMKEKNNK